MLSVGLKDKSSPNDQYQGQLKTIIYILNSQNINDYTNNTIAYTSEQQFKLPFIIHLCFLFEVSKFILDII